MRFLNPNLPPAIIGRDPGDMVWNPNDPVISEMGAYFRATLEDEAALCKSRIREPLLDEDVYLVSRIIDEQGFASVVARTAVER